jgi:uncharacterized protein YegJ (DUF2314 family)
LIAGFLGLCSLVAAIAATSEFEQLEKEAGRNISTDEGQRYLEQFTKGIISVFGPALNDCKEKPDTKEPAIFYFVVRADGTVKRLLYSRDIPFGVCVGSKLRAIKTLPKPPRDSWVVAFGAANHHHEEQARAKAAPADKSTSTRGQEQVDAYDRAIAPYVAKARASYPAAKKRYLAGLPPDHTFAVWIRLYQNDKKSRENRHEDVFVVVEQIKEGKIRGYINNKLDLLTNYQKGERIQFPESDVKNWVIVRPDGSEEGNDVGKFLEHWKPPKA